MPVPGLGRGPYDRSQALALPLGPSRHGPLQYKAGPFQALYCSGLGGLSMDGSGHLTPLPITLVIYREKKDG